MKAATGSLGEMRGMAKPYLLRLVEPRSLQTPAFAPGSGAFDFMHDHGRRNDDSSQRMSTDVLLSDVFEIQRYSGKKFEYCYDFGDSWDHQIKLVGRRAPARAFRCVDGQGHAAAEGVGSTGGWETLVKAYRAQRPSKEQKDKMSWYEQRCSNGDDLGLKGDWINCFDKDGINSILLGSGYLV